MPKKVQLNNYSGDIYTKSVILNKNVNLTPSGITAYQNDAIQNADIVYIIYKKFANSDYFDTLIIVKLDSINSPWFTETITDTGGLIYVSVNWANGTVIISPYSDSKTYITQIVAI